MYKKKDKENKYRVNGFTYFLNSTSFGSSHGKKVLLYQQSHLLGITEIFCYNNKMFSSINKTFGCCSKIFG